jgi:porphobilinogen deaminase
MKLESKKKDQSGDDFKVFNFRDIPTDFFFRMKTAASTEHQTMREWLVTQAERRIRELEQEGKLAKIKP